VAVSIPRRGISVTAFAVTVSRRFAIAIPRIAVAGGRHRCLRTALDRVTVPGKVRLVTGRSDGRARCDAISRVVLRARGDGQDGEDGEECEECESWDVHGYLLSVIVDAPVIVAKEFKTVAAKF